MFSVAISVYKKDNPVYFDEAMYSIQKQTLPPNEIVLVVDGPISSEIEVIIEKHKRNYENLNVIYLKDNMGHGIARQTGIINATNDIIAMMDSDDISLPDRFEKQYKIMSENNNISVLGGTIVEYDEEKQRICGYRIVPQTHSEIIKYMKNRCPFNQVSVMLRKSEIINAGGYKDWYMNEDYYLWIRMMMNGCKFKNISDVLVKVRVGIKMYARRGGWRYFKSEASLKMYMYENKLISFCTLLYNIIIRFIVQVVIPNRIRGVLFKYIFRSKR